MVDEETAVQTAQQAAEILPTLISRLADQLTQLVEAKLSLLRVELKEEFNSYLRGLVLIIAV